MSERDAGRAGEAAYLSDGQSLLAMRGCWVIKETIVRDEAAEIYKASREFKPEGRLGAMD